MARNLLHKTKLADFLAWCPANGHAVREGRGDFQLAQVRYRDNWHVVYSRIEMSEHVTVVAPLEPLVRQFIASTR